MTDSSRALMSYVQESVFATPPGTALKEARYTGESFHQATGTVSSAEIRPDRQVVGVFRNNIRMEGDLNFELSYGGQDDFLQAGLLSPIFTTQVSVTGTVHSMAVADNSINRSSGDYIADGFLPFSWIKISGFTDPANNQYFKILTVAAQKMVLTSGTAGVVVNEAAGDSVTIKQGEEIYAGTTLRTFSWERHYTDALTSTFENFRGCAIDQLSQNISADQIITGSASWIGKRGNSATATIGTGTITAAATNGSMNGIDNLFCTLENGLVVPSTALSWQLNNNLRTRAQLGSLGAISIGTGAIDLTGKYQAYFENSAQFDAYLDFTSRSLAYVLVDGTKAQIYDFPFLKFTDGKRVAGGINQDIIADLEWTAVRSPTEGKTMRIVRFP